MTRFTDKEKVALNRAKAEAATRFDGSETTDHGNFVQRWLRRAAIVRELSQLDDRMLADIGIQRWEIEAVADAATGGPRVSPLRALLRAIIAPVRRWHRRNQAYRQLASLDDRMLADIGITRADIPVLVRNWDGEPLSARREEEESSLIRGFRQWNRSRATARALHALDNHMLEDIGLVRGDIDWVAEELAAQSVWTAANRNQQSRAA